MKTKWTMFAQRAFPCPLGFGGGFGRRPCIERFSPFFSIQKGIGVQEAYIGLSLDSEPLIRRLSRDGVTVPGSAHTVSINLPISSFSFSLGDKVSQQIIPKLCHPGPNN